MKNHLQAIKIALLGIVLSTFTGNAQMIQPIYFFTNTIIGSSPYCGLALGPDGNFYGSVSSGSPNNGGTLFRVTTAGAFTPLVFLDPTNDGDGPYAALIVGLDGSLYGSNRGGSNTNNTFGSIFRLTTNGTLTVLATFDSHSLYQLFDGALAVGPDSNFYGVAANGGFNDDGSIFQITTNGAVKTLFMFGAGSSLPGQSTNGAVPVGGLTLGPDGYFYGTTSDGGTNRNGTLFKVTTNGALTTLIRFAGTNGWSPYARLKLGPDGYFYGTTVGGGTKGNWGTIFRVTTNGTVTLLYSLAGGIEGYGLYAGLAHGSDGNYYGASYYGGPNDVGTVYRVSPSGDFTSLAAFNTTNGANPRGDLVLGPDGNFYGTTEKGGSGSGGVIYRLDLPPAIVTDLSNQTVYAGGNVALSVNLFGTAPYSCEWLSNGVPVLVSTNSIFILSNLALSAAANYQVIITNTWGSVTSSVATLTVALPPAINIVSNSIVGGFTLSLTSAPGSTNVVWATTNLIPPAQWTAIASNVADTNGKSFFTDINTGSFRFKYYRLSVQ